MQQDHRWLAGVSRSVDGLAFMCVREAVAIESWDLTRLGAAHCDILAGRGLILWITPLKGAAVLIVEVWEFVRDLGPFWLSPP